MKVSDSNRLSYRQMGQQDGPLLFELDQDPQVKKYIDGGRITTQQEIEEVFLPRLKSYTDVDKGWGLWEVTIKDTGRYIGWVLVRPMDFFGDKPEWDNLELGWRFKRDAWGQGYATEAATAIRDALIENGGIRRLSALALEGNTASTNVMKKLGMEYRKTDICKDPLGDQEAVYYDMEV